MMQAKKVMSGHEAALTSVSYKAGCIVSTSMDGVIKVWSQKGSEVTSINSRSGALNTCSLGVRLVLMSSLLLVCIYTCK